MCISCHWGTANINNICCWESLSSGSRSLIFGTRKSWWVSLLNGLSQIACCKIFVEKANSNKSERIFLDSSQGLIAHLWIRKCWKRFLVWEIHASLGCFWVHQRQTHYNLQNQCTSLQFLRLLCLLLHKKYIPEMNSFILFAMRKKPDE